jgi:hypothetical protein
MYGAIIASALFTSPMWFAQVINVNCEYHVNDDRSMRTNTRNCRDREMQFCDSGLPQFSCFHCPGMLILFLIIIPLILRCVEKRVPLLPFATWFLLNLHGPSEIECLSPSLPPSSQFPLPKSSSYVHFNGLSIPFASSLYFRASVLFVVCTLKFPTCTVFQTTQFFRGAHFFPPQFLRPERSQPATLEISELDVHLISSTNCLKPGLDADVRLGRSGHFRFVTDNSRFNLRRSDPKKSSVMKLK